MDKPAVLRQSKSARYCQAIMVDDGLHIGGQNAYNSFGQDVKVQAEEIFGRIEGFLAGAGLTRENVVMAHVVLSDRADYAAFNEVWDRWISQKALPTRVCVVGQLIHDGCKAEVSVFAHRGDLTDA